MWDALAGVLLDIADEITTLLKLIRRGDSV
jgi:hypothetical protein